MVRESAIRPDLRVTVTMKGISHDSTVDAGGHPPGFFVARRPPFRHSVFMWRTGIAALPIIALSTATLAQAGSYTRKPPPPITAATSPNDPHVPIWNCAEIARKYGVGSHVFKARCKGFGE